MSRVRCTRLLPCAIRIGCVRVLSRGHDCSGVEPSSSSSGVERRSAWIEDDSVRVEPARGRSARHTTTTARDGTAAPETDAVALRS